MKFHLILFLLTSGSVWATDCFNCQTHQPLQVLAQQLPQWPIELIKVNEMEYERNSEASFCKRPTEMVDTIVLHHSETNSLATPKRINEIHLERGTKQDPWYMIAYSFVLTSPYPANSNPRNEKPPAQMTVGRPMDLVGAHAGSGAFVPMNSEQKKIWDEGKVVCGKEGGIFAVDPAVVQNGKIKANVTTIGLVVNGNYSPYSRGNLNGYTAGKTRNPTAQTQDMIARMACQLQKKYPRIKEIKWHNYYHSTSCPGTIKNYVNAIVAKANSYGCDFKKADTKARGY